MKAKELEKLIEGEYVERASSRYEIYILVKPPEIVLRYEGSPEYETPLEVDDYFSDNPKEEIYMAKDGFVYFNDKSSIRQKNIGERMRQLFNSEEIQQYINNLTKGSKLKLEPENLGVDTMEMGKNPHGINPYMTKCYNIPGENDYRLGISATFVEGEPEAHFNIFITIPKNEHFDGTDTTSYPKYLDIARGTVFIETSLESELGLLLEN